MEALFDQAESLRGEKKELALEVQRLSKQNPVTAEQVAENLGATKDKSDSGEKGNDVITLSQLEPEQQKQMLELLQFFNDERSAKQMEDKQKQDALADTQEEHMEADDDEKKSTASKRSAECLEPEREQEGDPDDHLDGQWNKVRSKNEKLANRWADKRQGPYSDPGNAPVCG